MTQEGTFLSVTVKPEIVYGYVEQPGLEPDIDVSLVLAILLLKEKIFLNDHWWIKEWPEEAKTKTSLNVVCSDVFSWGVADAETIDYKDIPEVFDYYLKDPEWGTQVFCIKRRKMKPQQPVYDEIVSKGIWNLDEIFESWAIEQED